MLECVKKHLDDQNLPIDGELSNFDFDLEKNQLTVNHRFIYNDKVRESFHIIPLSILW